jgi:hypothetical protein
VTLNVLVPLKVPSAVVTLTVPDVAPGITNASNELVDSLTTIAGTLPILTDWVDEKSVPVIVNTVPTAPDMGENVTVPALPPRPPPPVNCWDEPRQATVVISMAATTMLIAVGDV